MKCGFSSTEPDGDPYPYFVKIGTAGTFEETKNTRTTFGCGISNSGDKAQIENDCRRNPQCVGYYANQTGSWFVSTYKAPDECTEQDGDPYPMFYKIPWSVTPGVRSYEQDPDIDSKRIGSNPNPQSEEDCRTWCDSHPTCTHFDRTRKGECTFYRGKEWVGYDNRGGESHCRYNCQKLAPLV